MTKTNASKTASKKSNKSKDAWKWTHYYRLTKDGRMRLKEGAYPWSEVKDSEWPHWAAIQE